MTLSEFIHKAKAVHGDKYDYSRVEYVNNRTKVTIICPKHGEFLQAPYRHLRGYGCHVCGKERHITDSRQKLTQDEVLKRISSKLESTPYELVQPFIYQTDRNTRIKLRCTLHNETWEMSWHSFMYRPVMTNYDGCSGCRQKYSKEDCAKAAKLFSSRSEFEKHRTGEYMKALRMGWLDEICTHMNVVGNRYKRCIYAYIFELAAKYVYVGLTGNIIKRDKEHRVRSTSAVNKFAKQHQMEIPPVQQMTDYLPKDQAAIREGEVLQKFISNGYLPINIQKTGGLGGHLLDDGYTYSQCQEAAAKYLKRSEWKQKDYSTYYIASKYGWIDTIMPQIKPYGNKDTRYWTIEKCCEAAKECVTRSEFRERYSSAYVIVCRNKWNDVVFADIGRRPSTVDFDIDFIIKTLSQYPSISSFAKEHRNMINWLASHDINIQDIATPEQLRNTHHKVDYDLETIKEILTRYKSTAEFAKGNPSMANWLSRRRIKLSDIATPEQLHQSYVAGTKPIVQCDLDGNFIAEYNSEREPIGFDYKKISACCHGTRKSHKGYKWFFKKDYEQMNQPNNLS